MRLSPSKLRTELGSNLCVWLPYAVVGGCAARGACPHARPHALILIVPLLRVSTTHHNNSRARRKDRPQRRVTDRSTSPMAQVYLAHSWHTGTKKYGYMAWYRFLHASFDARTHQLHGFKALALHTRNRTPNGEQLADDDPIAAAEAPILSSRRASSYCLARAFAARAAALLAFLVRNAFSSSSSLVLARCVALEGL